MDALYGALRTVYADALADGGDFIDVGANIGAHTAHAARDGGGQVVAVEPNPTLFADLERRFADEPRVRVVNCVVAERDAPAMPFVIGDVDHELGSARPGYLEQFYPDVATRTERVEIPARSLDGLVRDLALTPAFVKIDTEGFEDEVFRGAVRMLARSRPQIAFEFNVGGVAQRGLPLRRLLDDHLYRIYDCFGHRLGPTTWAEPAITPIDRFAVPEEQAARFEATTVPKLRAYWATARPA